MLKGPLESQVKYVGIHLDFILESFLGLILHCDDCESLIVTSRPTLVSNIDTAILLIHSSAYARETLESYLYCTQEYIINQGHHRSVPQRLKVRVDLYAKPCAFWRKIQEIHSVRLTGSRPIMPSCMPVNLR